MYGGDYLVLTTNQLFIDKNRKSRMDMTSSTLMSIYGVTGLDEIDLNSNLPGILFGNDSCNIDIMESPNNMPLKESDFMNSQYEERDLTELTNADFREVADELGGNFGQSTNFTICSSFHVLNPHSALLDSVDFVMEDDMDSPLLIKEESLEFDSDSSEYSHSINSEPDETYMSDTWPVDNTISIDTSSCSNDDNIYFNHAKTADVFNIPKHCQIPVVCSESDSDSGESFDEKPARKKPGRKKGQVSRVLHLWEFIRDLLKDPKYSGHIIKWEDRLNGIFRIVKSSEVAVLWGQKKKNKRPMTYEKMSRSLRYSRKEGYFGAVPKEKQFPKKLCFKFGPKSRGWE